MGWGCRGGGRRQGARRVRGWGCTPQGLSAPGGSPTHPSAAGSRGTRYERLRPPELVDAPLGLGRKRVHQGAVVRLQLGERPDCRGTARGRQSAPSEEPVVSHTHSHMVPSHCIFAPYPAPTTVGQLLGVALVHAVDQRVCDELQRTPPCSAHVVAGPGWSLLSTTCSPAYTTAHLAPSAAGSAPSTRLGRAPAWPAPTQSWPGAAG